MTPEQEAQCVDDLENLMAKLRWLSSDQMARLRGILFPWMLAGREAEKLASEARTAELERKAASGYLAGIASEKHTIAQLQARVAELEGNIAVADRIARCVDNLLHRGGYNEDSSARHQLAMIFQPSPKGVPDELPQDPWDTMRVYDYRQGWNACRAAMIEGEKK